MQIFHLPMHHPSKGVLLSIQTLTPSGVLFSLTKADEVCVALIELCLCSVAQVAAICNDGALEYLAKGFQVLLVQNIGVLGTRGPCNSERPNLAVTFVLVIPITHAVSAVIPSPIQKFCETFGGKSGVQKLPIPSQL